LKKLPGIIDSVIVSRPNDWDKGSRPLQSKEKVKKKASKANQ
jgi:hypothetical protein